MMVKGRPLYVGAMVVDITERKLVEQALRSSEERFRSTFEQVAVGMSHVGIDGRWLRVNDRLCEIVGYDRHEMMQRTFQSITHPEDLAGDLAQKERVVAGEIDGYHMEKRYLHKNGSLVWVNLTVSAVRPPGQTTPAYLIAVVEDITERKSGEIRLQLLADLSEILATTLGDVKMLRSVVELLVPRLADWCVVNVLAQDDFIEPVAFTHVEAAKTIELARLIEERPLAATGDDGTPAVIRTGSPYFAPEITAAMIADDEHLARLVPIGVASMIIVPLRIREQSLGAITLTRSNPNRCFTAQDLGVAEELARRVAMAVDNARLYHETRATEAQLRQLNETLEERVTERTSELERSNRELDRFAYVASHDLKAPLRAIENLAFWIEEDAYNQLPEASRTHLHKLRSRVRRMERLLEDLLSYSRAGRVLHEPEEVDTGALARSVFDLLAPPPGFTLLLSDPMPIIYTQRVPLETVLRNLVGNAIKHHHREEGIIEIAVLDAGEQVEFSIRDDGPGIAPHYHGRVFEMFQTLQPRDHVEGSGMGLAIVKKLVESFGGTIRLHSVEGAGATFCFTWPKSKVVT
jgi:PAS domain S-box-containing protein